MQPKKPQAMEVAAISSALTPLVQSAGPLAHWAAVKSLASTEQFADCAKALAAVKDLFDQAEEQRKAITGPLGAVVKLVNAKAKELTGPLQKLGDHLKNLVLDYEAAERAKAEKEAEARAKKAEKTGAVELASDIRAQAETVTVLPGGTQLTMRDNWSAEMKDQLKFLKWVVEHPRDRMQYVKLDLAPLIAMSKALKGAGAPIPGVEWVNNKIVVNG